MTITVIRVVEPKSPRRERLDKHFADSALLMESTRGPLVPGTTQHANFHSTEHQEAAANHKDLWDRAMKGDF